MKFKLGDRIRISQNYHWAQGASGTITEPPPFVRQLVAGQAPWQGWRRFVPGVSGAIEFYWVTFDEPQVDADGDGPYTGGEIEADVIEPLS